MEGGYEPELQAETCACIQQVVRNLKAEYRVAIEQVDLAGESVESFAKAQGTTANNASVPSTAPGRQLPRN